MYPNSSSMKLRLLPGICILFMIDYCGYSTWAMNKMPPPEAKLYPGFSRQCPRGDEDCRFTAHDSPGNSLSFKCRENNVCFCSRGVVPEDVLVWPVQWDGEKCLVSKGGPCGEDQGFTVNCMNDLNCVQGRCRNSSEIHGGQVNQFCNDDMDCQFGLSCQAPSQNMEIRIKRCTSF